MTPCCNTNMLVLYSRLYLDTTTNGSIVNIATLICHFIQWDTHRCQHMESPSTPTQLSQIRTFSTMTYTQWLSLALPSSNVGKHSTSRPKQDWYWPTVHAISRSRDTLKDPLHHIFACSIQCTVHTLQSTSSHALNFVY